MTRKCNFDREEKLHQAMTLFWQKGYANTAISDLVDHLQINRFSLYNAFGDKQKLYYEALDRYLNLVSSPALKDLELESAAWPELKAFLQHFAALQREGNRGCFMQNALVEHADTDDEVLNKGHALFDHLLRLIARALNNAIQQGQIAAHLCADSLAPLVLTQMQGMRVLGKAQRHANLEQGLEALIRLIEGDFIEAKA
ncbi:TetR/AcrR family transcriptional regulator [Vibrio cholerae]|uniref:TetR/AcrR family transcriptional regulator n=1 Tax=Vibrio cholerae TaxID=666 RepID=UPI001302CFDD|nr:TetR/AcrR family transcriptional regulator [Vibrio cholerae]EGQ8139750.1 TetR/AcrR family transcriptional regulator [Vibrio cholerae]EGQ9899038.1 TetR/AcrR family transcriptional regulator [Vibrio cholerae]EGR0076402.1 TetR/AcrR family transcriptional regulator [Vibrio cholerae]EGR0564595.1 TetR/AcrR family transcriptional regulator [Vibrio cholerae]EJL6368962.1 TetR/AcrR family transcriptional regulator [Vibrio cholerae]